ncbi:AAA family ATPase [Luteimonas sp. A478]
MGIIWFIAAEYCPQREAALAGPQPRPAPILLSGPPACGKSWWARQVAQALGLPATMIVMPKVTASFVLSGSTASWSSARPGRIVEAFIGTDIANPVIIIDEIEKASAVRYDPTPVVELA